MLVFAACINVETTIFSVYYKEALGSLLLLAAIARPRFLVYIMKISVLTVAACINGETAIFNVDHKKALRSPLLHASMV